MSKTTRCELCRLDIVNKYFNFHLKSKKHMKNSDKGNDTKLENTIVSSSRPEISIDELEIDDDEDDEEDTGNYLQEFDNIPKVETFRETSPITTNSNDKLKNLFYKHTANKHKAKPQEDKIKKYDDDVISVMSDELFSKKATPILGKSYRENLTRIKQYKQLFKTELKTFRIKKNPTEQDLEAYLQEIQIILDCDSTQAYTNEFIFYILNILEASSSNFKDYNLAGLTAMLKGNIQFNQLVKVLSAKYNFISNTPSELLLALCVLSSVYVIVTENRVKNQLNERINEPIQPSKV